MPSFNFSREIRNPLKTSRKHHAFAMQKLFTWSFVLASTLMIFGKTFLHFSKKSVEASRQLGSKEQGFKNISLPDVLVSLKGKDGVRVGRISVELKVQKKKFKNSNFVNKNKVKKHLLLLLSGREVQEISVKKSYFEKELRMYLNAFLSEESIKTVTLKTKMLN